MVGWPTLRLKGHYLAMATLAIGLIVYEIAIQWQSVTQGYMGISGIPPLGIGGYEIVSDRGKLFALMVIVVLSTFAAARLRASRFGRALAAIAGSEDAARALGIDVAHYKLAAFLVSAAYAALAGSLFVHVVGVRQPRGVRAAHGRAGLHHALCRRHRHHRRPDPRRGDRQPAAGDLSRPQGLPGSVLRRGPDPAADLRAEGARRRSAI